MVIFLKKYKIRCFLSGGMTMKKLLTLILAFSVCSTLGAARLFFSNGESSELVRLDGFSAVEGSRLHGFKTPDKELLRLGLGSTVYSVIDGDEGGLPVYLLGETPVIANSYILWRGERSVDYMTEKYGMELAEILPSYPLYLFKVKGDSVVISEKIVKNGDGFAFPDLIRRAELRFVPEAEPQDPYFDVQWHLQNTGKVLNYQGGESEILKHADTKFIEMLQFLHENEIEVDPSVKIAIMDTGIVPDHEDLTNIEPGYDFLEDKEGGYPDTSVLDGNVYANYLASSVGHGTTCAGVSAGEGNTIGMTGMCPWCRLYPVRYLDGIEGTAVSDAKFLKAYEKYVADPAISVINCSFGPESGYGTIPITPGEEEGIGSFMKNGRNGLGGVVVYASGNEGVDSAYNQIFEHDFTFRRNGQDVTNRVITVNASTAWDTRALYSNYGAATTVIAPSLSQYPIIGIATTMIPKYGDYKSDYTLLFSGTSAAAPMVSGFFGAILSINPELTLEEVTEILKKSADKVYPETGSWDDDGFSVKFGYGRINLEKAARLAAGFEMCTEVKDEICGNHLDDDCDGYVDEECSSDPVAGWPCETDDDCMKGSFTAADVKCIHSFSYYKFKDGTCMRLTNNATCPDGTKPVAELDGAQGYLCALECSAVSPCQREGHYCSNDVLGVCLPHCEQNEDCNTGSECTAANKCVKIPESLGGPCGADSECEGEYSWCNYWSLPGGYCTQDCFDNDDSVCPDNSICVTVGRRNREMCLASCNSDSACRVEEGYICHARYSTREGLCYTQCRGDSDCRDEDAYCNEEGRCVTEGWTGWPETDDKPAAGNDDDISGEPDTDSASGAGSDSELSFDDDPQGSGDKENKKSSGCTLGLI